MRFHGGFVFGDPRTLSYRSGKPRSKPHQTAPGGLIVRRGSSGLVRPRARALTNRFIHSTQSRERELPPRLVRRGAALARAARDVLVEQLHRVVGSCTGSGVPSSKWITKRYLTIVPRYHSTRRRRPTAPWPADQRRVHQRRGGGGGGRGARRRRRGCRWAIAGRGWRGGLRRRGRRRHARHRPPRRLERLDGTSACAWGWARR